MGALRPFTTFNTLTLNILFSLFSTYLLENLLKEVLCTLLNYIYFYNYL